MNMATKPPKPRPAVKSRIDAVTASVIQAALESIATEKLMRMAYSSIIREAEGLGAALVAAKGWQLCRSTFVPHDAEDRRAEMPSEIPSCDVKAGETVTATAGAGDGRPHERATDAIAADVADGLIDTTAARSKYGVALDGKLKLGRDTTAKLRSR